MHSKVPVFIMHSKVPVFIMHSKACMVVHTVPWFILYTSCTIYSRKPKSVVVFSSLINFSHYHSYSSCFLIFHSTPSPPSDGSPSLAIVITYAFFLLGAILLRLLVLVLDLVKDPLLTKRTGSFPVVAESLSAAPSRCEVAVVLLLSSGR